MVKSYQDALRRLWDGLCDVYVLETAVNKANGRDEPTEAPESSTVSPVVCAILKYLKHDRAGQCTADSAVGQALYLEDCGNPGRL